MFRFPRSLLRTSPLLLVAVSACTEVVGPPVVTRVEISAAAEQVAVGRSVDLQAVARDAAGGEVSGATIVWSSSQDSVLEVDDGRATGRSVGRAFVRAEAGGVRDSIEVVVVPLVQRLEVEPTTLRLLAGERADLRVRALDGDGLEVPAPAVVWGSEDDRVARVDSSGSVLGWAPGQTSVSVEAEGVRAEVEVVVTAGPLPDLGLQEVARGIFPAPTFLTSAPGDTRLLVGSVNGGIVQVRDGEDPAPFLDLTDRVHHEGERGMYSLAFHPRYSQNGHFYVSYADHRGQLQIVRFTTSTGADRADRSSAKTILTVPHPENFEHFGGALAFGPDGMLFISVGDGGKGHAASAQDPGSMLGSILRIDVDGGDPYAVPADNPFVGRSGHRPEVWATGLRNPWRISFDHDNGRLYIADVGENGWEEINVVSLTDGGANFGWPVMEGSHCFPLGTSGCDRAGLTLPVLEYANNANPFAPASDHPRGCSVTGGYVYRGLRMPSLRGHYLYGDFCGGWVRSFRYENGRAVEQRGWTLPNLRLLVSFGEDAEGELYALPNSGTVYRFVP